MDMAPFSPSLRSTSFRLLECSGSLSHQRQKKNQILRHLVLTYPHSRAPPGKVLLCLGSRPPPPTIILSPSFFYNELSCIGLPTAGKESAYNVGDLGSIPGLGRSPGEGKGYPLQYSGLENSMQKSMVSQSQT